MRIAATERWRLRAVAPVLAAVATALSITACGEQDSAFEQCTYLAKQEAQGNDLGLHDKEWCDQVREQHFWEQTGAGK